MTDKILSTKPVIIFSGHFGSGKTENAVNYCLHLNSQDYKVSIVDLDIINPYFRSREAGELMEEKGIHTILPPRELQHADFPIIPPQIKGAIVEQDGKLVIDLGGNPDGALPVGGLQKEVTKAGYDMWLVINANRPQTSSVEEIKELARKIESTSRLKFTGIINNTHLKQETTIQDILTGLELCREVENTLNIPIKYSAIPKKLTDEIDDYKSILGDFLIVDNYLTNPLD
ncbi:ATP-binding protein [Natranaerobius trueperi]|uniref:ATP-binding protein n=1 Tax=Natranaerobius trueperi TaxID=759412 RepID=A0A226C0M1_9FIRM|nr:ATP-binding protein [Natranaerobius trueperi]OWZ83999.1 ATP-binding protein [Natranaerobius trueperi]